ncbi:ATP-binding protein [Flaviflexus huanghaiensis]|uniref:ATP-binding protein n=1 Tax=Flaviflexus huanghaiensis TaxID=1111473 RepID=UPI0015FDCF6E|nr:ATP-binding protein [Flaviflexus huanghaiensis]
MTPHRVWLAQSAEYTELVSILTRPGPGGALILGGFGIGKTTLVRAALARPDVPPPAMRVHASPTLAGEPCGALSPYLSARASTDSPAQVLREVGAVLAAAQTPGVIPIVVVEDAEFLDDETSFVLSTLVENAAIKLVAIGNGRTGAESTLFALAESGLLSTLVVQPLDRVGVRFLAEEIAGGEFTAPAIDIMTALTGGNPSFVEAVVQSCLDQGLVFRHSPGVANGDLLTLARLAPEADEPLTELVRDVTRSLSAEHRRVLELLALAGPQPGSVLFAMCGEHRRLVEADLLAAGHDGLLRIASDIFATILRSTVPPGRSAQLYAAWSEHRAPTSRTPLQVLWALEVGADVPADQVLGAVEDAVIGCDFRLARKLIDAEVTPESDAANLLRARTLIGLGRHYSARTLLMRVAETSTDHAVRQQALHLLLMAFDQLTRDPADVAAFERWWAEQSRAPGREGALAGPARFRQEGVARPPQIERGLRAAPHSVAEVERILASPDLTADGRICVLIDLADLHSVAGRTETALEVARSARAALADERMVADYELLILFRIGWNLVLSGRYDEAEDLLAHSSGPSCTDRTGWLRQCDDTR